jgi:RNA polymerase sigma-70 factor, ECF subfamily
MSPSLGFGTMGRTGQNDESFLSAKGFEALVRTQYDQVWRLCALLVDAASADDLAQETFLRAYRTFATFRGESSVRTWVFAVARHACLDELRARGRRRDVSSWLRSEVLEAHDPAADVVMAALLSGLEHDRRSAFVLTQVFGLSYAEAARVCQCPVGTIRSRVARARKDLIAAIEEGRTLTEDATLGPGLVDRMSTVVPDMQMTRAT